MSFWQTTGSAKVILHTRLRMTIFHPEYLTFWQNSTVLLCESVLVCLFSISAKLPSDRTRKAFSAKHCARGTSKTSFSKCKRGFYQCSSDSSCISQRYICDGRNDCPSGDDEMICSCSKTSDSLLIPFACFQKSLNQQMLQSTEVVAGEEVVVLNCKIPKRKLCIYERASSHRKPLYCPNSDHLQKCSGYKCEKHFHCLLSYCIPHRYVCDGTWDCPSGQDESDQLCLVENCVHLLRCRDQRLCIALSLVCDSMQHCKHGDDEVTCMAKADCPHGCVCLFEILMCQSNGPGPPLALSNLYQTRITFLILQSNGILLSSVGIENFHSLLFLNLSNSQIRKICYVPSVFRHLTRLSILDLSANLFLSLETICFENLYNLKRVIFKENTILEVDPFSFMNLGSLPKLMLTRVQLKVLGPYFFITNRTNKLYLLDLSNNYLSHLPQKAFCRLSNLKILLIQNNFLQLLHPASENQGFLFVVVTDHFYQCHAFRSGRCLVSAQTLFGSRTTVPNFRTVFSIVVSLCALGSSVNMFAIFALRTLETNYSSFLQVFKLLNDTLFLALHVILPMLWFANLTNSVNLLFVSCIVNTVSIACFFWDIFLNMLDIMRLHKILSAKTSLSPSEHSKIPRMYAFLSFCLGIIGTVIAFVSSSYYHGLVQHIGVADMFVYAFPFAMPLKVFQQLITGGTIVYLFCYCCFYIMCVKHLAVQVQLMKVTFPGMKKNKENVLLKQLHAVVGLKICSDSLIICASVGLIASDSVVFLLMMIFSQLHKTLVKTVMVLVMSQQVRNSFSDIFFRGCVSGLKGAASSTVSSQFTSQT